MNHVIRLGHTLRYRGCGRDALIPP